MGLFLVLALPLFLVAAVITALVLRRQPRRSRVRRTATAAVVAAVAFAVLAVPSDIRNRQVHQPRAAGVDPPEISETWSWFVTVTSLLDYVAFLLLAALLVSLALLLAPRLLRWSLEPYYCPHRRQSS